MVGMTDDEKTAYIEAACQHWAGTVPALEYWVLGEERGAKGETPHIQGFLSFATKVRLRNAEVAFSFELGGNRIVPHFGKEADSDTEMPFRKNDAYCMLYCLKEGLVSVTNVPVAKLRFYWDSIAKSNPEFLQTRFDGRTPAWYFSDVELGADAPDVEERDEPESDAAKKKAAKFKLYCELVEITRNQGWEEAMKWFEQKHPVMFVKQAKTIAGNLQLMTQPCKSLSPKYPLEKFDTSKVHPDIIGWFNSSTARCLYVRGDSRLGKTQFLVAYAASLGSVMIASITEDLKAYRSNDFIIYDDFAFESVRYGGETGLIHLSDEVERGIDVKNGCVVVHDFTRKIFTSNDSLSAVLAKFRVSNKRAEAIKNRFVEVTQVLDMRILAPEEQLEELAVKEGRLCGTVAIETSDQARIVAENAMQIDSALDRMIQTCSATLADFSFQGLFEKFHTLYGKSKK
jgi:hypothetical protein